MRRKSRSRALFVIIIAGVLTSSFVANGFAVSPEKDLKIGAYYYIWWGIPFNNHWEHGVKLTPFLGEYNSNDSLTADRHIILAKDHGIDFFAVSWIGNGSWIDWDFDDIDQNLRSGLLCAPHLQGFSFCLFYETKLVLDTARDISKNFTKIFINDMVYAAETYFDYPSYLRVDGKPVLFIYNLPYLYENLSISEVQRLLDVTRQLLANIDCNIYLVGDCGGGPLQPCVDSYLLHSMNAMTSYFFSDPSKDWEKILEDAENYYPKWLQVADSKGIKFIPNAYPGFDNTEHCEWMQRTLNISCTPIVLPLNETMFEDMLNTAIHCAENDSEIIMITSWNEWLESTAIEPSMEFGELFLHAIYLIPEFPSFLILLLFMTATLLAVIVHRRTHF